MAKRPQLAYNPAKERWNDVYYLRAIPWQIEDFTVEGYRDKLLALHEQMEREGGLRLASHRFYLEAIKP